MDQIIYTVHFLEVDRIVGCREELIGVANGCRVPLPAGSCFATAAETGLAGFWWQSACCAMTCRSITCISITCRTGRYARIGIARAGENRSVLPRPEAVPGVVPEKRRRPRNAGISRLPVGTGNRATHILANTGSCADLSRARGLAECCRCRNPRKHSDTG